MVLSVKDNGIYDEFNKTIRETWYKDQVDGVETIFYYSSSKSEMIGDELFIQSEEGIENLGHKVISSLEYVLDNIEFDYIFKMNCSSYLNKKMLKDILINKPRTNFYSGFMGIHYGIRFVSGSGTILSKDLVKLIVDSKYNWNHSYIEDVSIGKIMMDSNVNITNLNRVDITNGLDYNLINIKNHHYRCKNSNRKYDIIILKELYKKYKNKMYNILCNEPSDINEHLPTLKEIASECDTVTEMGVRFVVSTWALVEASPKKITCYDININFFEDSKGDIEKVCQLKNIDFKFIESDTLKLEIENTDFLFIDTLHTYNQLYKELNIHSKNVNKYIALHDTVSFGYNDEFIYNHASDIIKNEKSEKQGLIKAIEDFLITDEGKKWTIDKVYKNNNGLTVLKKII